MRKRLIDFKNHKLILQTENLTDIYVNTEEISKKNIIYQVIKTTESKLNLSEKHNDEIF